jgi:hypothetical protein
MDSSAAIARWIRSRLVFWQKDKESALRAFLPSRFVQL